MAAADKVEATGITHFGPSYVYITPRDGNGNRITHVLGHRLEDILIAQPHRSAADDTAPDPRFPDAVPLAILRPGLFHVYPVSRHRHPRCLSLIATLCRPNRPLWPQARHVIQKREGTGRVDRLVIGERASQVEIPASRRPLASADVMPAFQPGSASAWCRAN